MNIFSSQFLFHKANYHFNESKTHHCNILDNIMFNTSSDPNIVVVVSDTSIKNNIATSITYIHLFNSLLKKMLYYTISITSTEQNCLLSDVRLTRQFKYMILFALL